MRKIKTAEAIKRIAKKKQGKIFMPFQLPDAHYLPVCRGCAIMALMASELDEVYWEPAEKGNRWDVEISHWADVDDADDADDV